MPQLTVKQVIQSTLVKVCREVTAKLRPTEEPKPRKYSPEQVAEIHALLKALGWSSDKIIIQSKINAALFDAPELEMPAMIPLDLFCVVVLESNDGGHGYKVGEPHILTSTNSRTLLHIDGLHNHWVFHTNDNPRLATDEEIQYCIEALTDKQWQTIRINPIFESIMDEAMAQEVTVDKTDYISNDSKEVTLLDGRKITVDAE